MKIRIALAIAVVGLALAPAAVRADSQEQQNQQACMNDAMTVCGQFIPDRERVAGCLIQNRSRISAACRSALAHFKARTAASR